MACDLRVQIGHLRGTPSKQINILSQAGLQLFPRCADLHSFDRIFTKREEL
ncbi:hypothetical protein A2U01_0110288, partial [Trifolium medium]|nr:hypothetical protein [Trifolium medium]